MGISLSSSIHMEGSLQTLAMLNGPMGKGGRNMEEPKWEGVRSFTLCLPVLRACALKTYGGKLREVTDITRACCTQCTGFLRLTQ